MTSTEQLLADRYGRRPVSGVSKNRRRGFVFGALALTGFTIWAVASLSAPTSAVSVVSSVSKPLGRDAFEVSGKVVRPVGGLVRCALQVQALNFAVVGYREITLEAGVTSFSTKVFTIAPGVSASVARCWLQ